MEWLQRSVVCIIGKASQLGALTLTFTDGYVQWSIICALTYKKYIFTFLSTSQIEETLRHQYEFVYGLVR